MKIKIFFLLLFITVPIFGQLNQSSFPTTDLNGKVWQSFPVAGSNFSKIDESYDSTGSDFIYSWDIASNQQSFTIGIPPIGREFGKSDLSVNIQFGSYANSTLTSVVSVVVKDSQSVQLFSQSYSVLPISGYQNFTFPVPSVVFSNFPLSIYVTTAPSCTISGMDNSCRVRIFSLVFNYLNITSNYMYM